jgi:hypothetical protein
VAQLLLGARAVAHTHLVLALVEVGCPAIVLPYCKVLLLEMNLHSSTRGAAPGGCLLWLALIIAALSLTVQYNLPFFALDATT